MKVKNIWIWFIYRLVWGNILVFSMFVNNNGVFILKFKVNSKMVFCYWFCVCEINSKVFVKGVVIYGLVNSVEIMFIIVVLIRLLFFCIDWIWLSLFIMVCGSLSLNKLNRLSVNKIKRMLKVIRVDGCCN